MSLSLTESENIKNPILFLKPSQGLTVYFCLLGLLAALSFLTVAFIHVFLWLFFPFFLCYLWLIYRKSIQLRHPRSIVGLQYKQSGHWLVHYKMPLQVFAEQASKAYKTPWFLILPLRAVASKELFFVFVPKDSVTQLNFQLLLYQLT